MKLLYLIGGLISLGFACLGMILPLLPAFPFLVFSGFCFTRSNEKLHNWLIHTKMYKTIVIPFKEEKKMTLKNKVIIMISITLLMSIGFVMMHKILLGQIILIIIWLFHLYYFTFKIKTKSY